MVVSSSRAYYTLIASCGDSDNLTNAADFSLSLGTARRAPTKKYLFDGHLV